MKKIISIAIILICYQSAISQQLLTSWSQQDIENYTKEMYDEAQKLSTSELLTKNLNVQYWSEIFLILNASVNNYSENTEYKKKLTTQLINKKETKLKGTSRLIIWDRIISGDIIFEGKGLVIENDLFTVAGRANQILQNLTKKNFGYVTVHSTKEELKALKSKWMDFLSNKEVKEFKPTEYENAKIPEISSLKAAHALILSLQENPIKNQITKNCLRTIYNLDELPKDKSSPANYCNPNTYTYAYLGMLFGDEKTDEKKNAKWWKNFWDMNHEKLVWNNQKGIYEIKK